jgi:hypothetical protein
MSGLLSIAPVTETVAGVPVRGVSVLGIAQLLSEFKELRAFMSGRPVSVDEIVAVAPGAIAKIIAAGVGYPGVQEQIEAAEALPIDLQADFIEAILRLTLPRGAQGFLDKFLRLQSSLGISATGTAD